MPLVKSVLPPDLELKRRTIAKRHNQLVILLACGTFALLFVVAIFVPHGRTHHNSALLCLLGVISCEAYGIYRIFQYDYSLCRRWGYVCHSCHTPLFGRTSPWLKGICPKCEESLF